jgi:hypothetical protein
MKFSDIVIVLMVLTFIPFCEGIIAKSPLWKKLADSIELGLIKAFTWRANSNVTNELSLLTRYFKRASIFSSCAFCISLFLLKSQPLIIWTSFVTFFCLFALFSFKWTFKHREAIQPLAPLVGYSLLGPWAMLLLDYLSPKAGLMSSFARTLTFLPFQPSTPFEVATVMFIFFVAIFVCYYILGWVLLSPFAYFVLAGLKASRSLSKYIVLHFNRNLLNDISVTVQFGFPPIIRTLLSSAVR